MFRSIKTAASKKRAAWYQRKQEASHLKAMRRGNLRFEPLESRLVLDGGYTRKGISPPEFVGLAEGCRERVESYLAERGVRYRKQRA